MRNKQQSTNNTDEEEEEQHLHQLPQIVGSKNVHKRQILFFLWPFMILLDIDT